MAACWDEMMVMMRVGPSANEVADEVALEIAG